MRFALLPTVSCLVLALCFAFWQAPRATLLTHMDIHATPEQIWELLGNPHSYQEWNPFIVSMQGVLREGQRLETLMHSEGSQPIRFRPTVLKVVPAQELRWRGRLLLPRVFDGEHYFELQEQTEAGNSRALTRLTHGENFQGVLLWWIDVQRFQADFVRMNLALKTAVEQRHPPH